MKIKAVAHNNRSKTFELQTGATWLRFPYSKADPVPTAADPVTQVTIDAELGREGFVFELASGRSGCIHVEQVLEYNDDPRYLRDVLLYRLTLEARNRTEASPLAVREIVRRLGTSPAQLYRLLDQTNYRKSIDQMLALLHVLDCEVDLVVRHRDRRAPGRLR